MKEKKNKTDFALWKFSGDKKRLQEWESPWGIGFPGWHIECSAMSIKYLGKHFDIHTGGQDNMPIHHENEIAQSEAAYNEKPWVNFWMHGAQLLTGGGKMAKSSGTIKTISQLEKEGINPLAYRYFTYSAHYRKPLTWSSDAINTAANSFKRLKNIILKIENKRGLNKKYLEEFEGKINDDLEVMPETRLGDYSPEEVYSAGIIGESIYFGLSDFIGEDEVAVVNSEGVEVSRYTVGAIPGDFAIWSSCSLTGDLNYDNYINISDIIIIIDMILYNSSYSCNADLNSDNIINIYDIIILITNIIS